jgi:hypothetical protein
MAPTTPRLPRWTPDPDGLGGAWAAARKKTAFFALAALWNWCLPHAFSPAFPWYARLITVAAGAAFAYGALRGVCNATRARFAGGQFVCRSGPLPPHQPFTHDAYDVDGFAVAPADDGDGFVIQLVTRGGDRRELPIDLNGLVFTVRGSGQAVTGLAPREHAEYVAERLCDALGAFRYAQASYRR